MFSGRTVNSDRVKILGILKSRGLTLEQIKENVVGKTEAEANKWCAGNELILRVTREDGKGLIGTCDLRSDRLNVETVNGIISVIKGIG